MLANRSISFPYRGRTDDVMKLLMIGFEGLFHLCNPSSHKWDGTPLVDRAGLGFLI